MNTCQRPSLVDVEVVHEFVGNLCVLEPTAWVSLETLHRTCREYCLEKWRPIPQRDHFLAILLESPEVRFEQRVIDKHRVNGISGIRLLEPIT